MGITKEMIEETALNQYPVTPVKIAKNYTIDTGVLVRKAFVAGANWTVQQMNNDAINQAIYTDGTAISALPTNDVMYGNESTGQAQSLPNYNSAPVNQEGFNQGPVAASEFLGGGGGFGSAW
jgi:hypothetical protein